MHFHILGITVVVDHPIVDRIYLYRATKKTANIKSEFHLEVTSIISPTSPS